MNFVYYSCVDWNSTWQRPQQLATRLSSFGRMLYVNPLGTRSLHPKDIGRVWNRFTFGRRSGDWSRYQGLTVHNPLYFLPFAGSDAIDRFNGKILSRIQRRWMDQFRLADPIVWIGAPSRAVLQAIKNVPSRLVIYDCMDDFAHFHNDPGIAETEFQLASRAHIVFATAKKLYNRMKTINPHTFHLPNATDFEHFSLASNRCLPLPEEISALPGPILGYYGELADWFDFELVERVARENPHWTVVLIGKMNTKAGLKLKTLSNVHFLGQKPYRELPAYLSCFDVCLLPFRLNELTSSVNPVKLYEYLSAGKPVVSTAIDEVLPLADLVEIAEPTQFTKAIERALQTQADEKGIAKRQDFAGRNTWEKRIQEMIAILIAEGSVAA